MASWPGRRYFAEIDSQHRGYVTFDELSAWRVERKRTREKLSD